MRIQTVVSGLRGRNQEFELNPVGLQCEADVGKRGLMDSTELGSRSGV